MQACFKLLKRKGHRNASELIVVAAEQAGTTITPITVFQLRGYIKLMSAINARRDGLEIINLMTPLIYQTGPKTSAKSGWSCSMREKRCISGRSLPSGIMGIRS